LPLRGKRVGVSQFSQGETIANPLIHPDLAIAFFRLAALALVLLKERFSELLI